MNNLVNISNRPELYSLLLLLQPETLPLWGKMNTLQMVEHLIDNIKYSNGKKTTSCFQSQEDARQDKEKWIYTDAQIPRNLILQTLPENPENPDLETAILQLMNEVDDFHQYFKEPGATAVHAAYGSMNYQEWLIWHGKHFSHHFKQFSIIASPIF